MTDGKARAANEARVATRQAKDIRPEASRDVGEHAGTVALAIDQTGAVRERGHAVEDAVEHVARRPTVLAGDGDQGTGIALVAHRYLLRNRKAPRSREASSVSTFRSVDATQPPPPAAVAAAADERTFVTAGICTGSEGCGTAPGRSRNGARRPRVQAGPRRPRRSAPDRRRRSRCTRHRVVPPGLLGRPLRRQCPPARRCAYRAWPRRSHGA